LNIALIAPVSQLHHCMGRPIQMMIPQFEHHWGYQKYFKMFSHDLGTFVMLDNGAFEGNQLTDSDLLNMAAEYAVDEVAIPDVLGDANATLFQLEKFVSVYKHPSHSRHRVPRLLAIVQGQTFEECAYCIDTFAFDKYTNLIATIGIPKHLRKTTGQLDVRIELARYINTKYPLKWDVHFLGYNSPGETMEAAALGARSQDTGAPFVCTAENMDIGGDMITAAPEMLPRQNWFDNLGPEYFHPKLVKHNIDLLDKWATNAE
jgi:hypothetical protein